MDTGIHKLLAAALPHIERSFEALRDARARAESAEWQKRFGGTDDDGWSSEQFEHQLRSTKQIIAVVLEGCHLFRSRKELLSRWEGFCGKGLSTLRFLPEVDAFESGPYSYLTNLLSGLRALAGSPLEQSLGQDQLERLLHDTARLVKLRRGDTAPPEKEGDVQRVMHDYLAAIFPDFVAAPKIAGPIRAFYTDGGIPTLASAIEFKFVASKDDMKRTLAEVYADMGGYAGCRDYRTFYAVFYQTGPFESQARLASEFSRSGKPNWIPILVTGEGPRRDKTRRRNSKIP